MWTIYKNTTLAVANSTLIYSTIILPELDGQLNIGEIR